MKFSSRAKYGIRICFLMGLKEGEHVSLSALVTQTGLSSKYMERILAKLKSGGLAESVRGCDGGYYLSKNTNDISVKDILVALDDDFVMDDCSENKCKNTDCPSKKIFKRLYDNIQNILVNTSLRDLIQEYNNK